MKDLHADASQDLDAAWDEIASAQIPVAVKPVDSQPPEVEELDAGWELESPSLEPAKKSHTAPTRPGLEYPKEPPLPVASSQVTLTKKARRELERQNRMHEAKRRAEAKVQKKEQRRTKQTEAKPTPQTIRGAIPSVQTDAVTPKSGHGRKKKRNHAKSADIAARKALRQDSKPPAAPVSKAAGDSKLDTAREAVGTSGSKSRSAAFWWILAILFLAIVMFAVMSVRH